RFLRKVTAPSAAGLEDQQLLQRFAAQGDDLAFEALVKRHGPLVLGVCRRVLGDAHAAEDAFQATFLVLVRTASTVRKQTSLGSWLYGVAYRTALKARADAARWRAIQRRAMTSPVADSSTPEPSTDAARAELREALDQEVSRLPEKYRVPVILCYLE